MGKPKDTSPNRSCTRCKRKPPEVEYYSDNYGTCKECCREIKRNSRKKVPELDMFNSARARARKAKVPFEITKEDIVIPEECPILGIPLVKGKGKVHDASPSLDRKIPSKGYTKENIWVVSYRANMLKSDATSEELKKVIEAIIKIEGGDL